MKSIKFSIAVIVLSFLLSYCNNYKNATNETEVLFRNDWRLTEVQGQVIPETTKTSFQFSPGKISGSTGCNRLSAAFTAGRHQTIKFTPGATTKMACEESAMSLENKFLDALTKSDNWNMENGELWLATGKTTLLKFKSL